MRALLLAAAAAIGLAGQAEAATIAFTFTSGPMVKVQEPWDFPEFYDAMIGRTFTVRLLLQTNDPDNINAYFEWVAEDDIQLPVTVGGTTLLEAGVNGDKEGGIAFNELRITTDAAGVHHFEGYFANDTPDFMFGDDWFGVGHTEPFIMAAGTWTKTALVPLPAAGGMLLAGLGALAAVGRQRLSRLS
jgi:hypothetical protein